MRIEDYPPQEPFSAVGARYHEEAMRRGAGVAGIDVSYGPDPYQSLLICPARKPSGIVLAMIHGGGWTNGYKEWLAFMAPGLNQRGVTIVSIGYRLAPQHVFPAGYQDCVDGVAKIHRIIAEHGGDPERLYVGGHSAGGHYASLLGVTTDWQTPRGLPADIIKGCLPISGTYYFGEGSGLSMRPRFLGPPEGNTEVPASPIRHINSGTPPFLISYGASDFPHLIRQAAEFATELRKHGNTVRELSLKGADHFQASYVSGDPAGIWIEQACEFMSGNAE